LAAVEISHLRKTYGPLIAVDDVSLSVTEGEIISSTTAILGEPTHDQELRRGASR
jgi:ABC-type Na+ transport system ATPase subunit NatA